MDFDSPPSEGLADARSDRKAAAAAAERFVPVVESRPDAAGCTASFAAGGRAAWVWEAVDSDSRIRECEACPGAAVDEDRSPGPVYRRSSDSCKSAKVSVRLPREECVIQSVRSGRSGPASRARTLEGKKNLACRLHRLSGALEAAAAAVAAAEAAGAAAAAAAAAVVAAGAVVLAADAAAVTVARNQPR